MYVCLLITLTCSPKAELRRVQLNEIGRMHMKGASGCRQMVMNDPGAQQPSQMFLTWVKARPQHRELRVLLLTNSVWVPKRPTVIYNKRCKTGPPAYSPYPRRLESLIIC